jgi:hypothetical protein
MAAFTERNRKVLLCKYYLQMKSAQRYFYLSFKIMFADSALQNAVLAAFRGLCFGCSSVRALVIQTGLYR